MSVNTCTGAQEWVIERLEGLRVARPAPPPTPQDLIPSAFASVEERLPTPVLRINPADGDAQGFAYVHVETFFWIDQIDGQWAPVSATVSLRGLTLTLIATPARLTIDTGDDHHTVCDGPPPPYPASMPDEFPEGCGHTYVDSSAMAPNGRTYPVTATITWTTAWAASDGQSGTLETSTTTSAVRDLPVAEIQAVIVANPD
ncbi:MAG: hypothetical protein ACK5OX_03960 [Desertimonas sp.]